MARSEKKSSLYSVVHMEECGDSLYLPVGSDSSSFLTRHEKIQTPFTMMMMILLRSAPSYHKSQAHTGYRIESVVF